MTLVGLNYDLVIVYLKEISKFVVWLLGYRRILT